MRILIADDSPIFRCVLTAMLTAWGHEVVVARDGEEAWERLQEPDAPRLVMLDWIMPGLDGLQICNLIRAREGMGGRGRTQVLMVSAKDARSDVETAMLAGADGYVSKPFHLQILHDRLRAAIASLDLPVEGDSARNGLFNDLARKLAKPFTVVGRPTAR